MPHGLNATYVGGCRCPECKAAHAEVQKAFYKRRVEQRIEELGLKDRPCDWCGSVTSPKEYDHVRPVGKTATYAELFRTGSDEQIKAEIERCGIQVLCGKFSENRCHMRKKSIYRYDGRVVVLPDGGYMKRSHPVRLGGEWIGWTCDDAESVETLYTMLDSLDRVSALLDQQTAALKVAA